MLGAFFELFELVGDLRRVTAAAGRWEEFAKSLVDIVFRRCMVGLDHDQGRPLYATIADIASEEFGWDPKEKSRQLDELVDYSESLRVAI
mgnify:CR=1 FL=1